MIDPRGMTWRDWADSVVLSVSDVWSFGTPPEEAAWRDFAVGFVRAPEFAQRVPPDPYVFTDWREWAMRMYPILEGTA
jgi:hypothetical protein